MKRHFPGPIELAVFLGMAVLCAMVVSLSSSRDIALALCTGPVFLTAALMGFRRSEIARLRQLADEEVDESEPVA